MILWPNIPSWWEKKSDDRLYWIAIGSFKVCIKNQIHKLTHALLWLRSIFSSELKTTSIYWLFDFRKKSIKLNLSTYLSRNSKFNIFSFWTDYYYYQQSLLWYFVDTKQNPELCKQPQNYRLLRVRSIIKLHFAFNTRSVHNIFYQLLRFTHTHTHKKTKSPNPT